MSAYEALSPLLFRVDPERAHRASIRAAAWGLVPQAKIDEPRLRVSVAGLDFPNPLGLAAGYDKDGEAWKAMLGTGFGHVEIGTVTPRPQPGNARPRVFRLVEDRAVVNRYGFNSAGAAIVRDRLRNRRRNGILGVNVGANKTSDDFAADYVQGIETFAEGADYLTINVSSPNTPGLRALQGAEPLADLLERACDARDSQPTRRPLFLKIAPDLNENEMDTIARTVLASGVDALVVSNTTVARPDLRSPHAGETGGLSGRPLLEPSTHVLREMARRLERKLPLVGVGGVEDAAGVIAKIEAGASLVQLYTAMVFRGPSLAARIVGDLRDYCRDRDTSVEDMIAGAKV